MSRYELLERIGVGGMAEIFRGRATAIGGFEKPVAIKKILPQLVSDARFVKMLIAEANILASLRHRNVVQIFDVGLSDQGEYFLVMEYVDGCDLGALYDRMVAVAPDEPPHRFPIDLALHVACEVSEALEHAHHALDAQQRPLQLIHRDVSPANVMLSFAGEVKLADFGVAKRAQHASVIQSLKGKFAYMSPEQARGETVDRTSDLYSLGIILYELLLGRRLFEHQDQPDVIALVQAGLVTRPTDVDPALPRGLEDLLLKALAPDPRDRFASAAEMGAALRDYRYAAATSAADPARELSLLLARFAPKRVGRRAAGVVRLTTVLPPAGAAPVTAALSQDSDTFDEPGEATTVDDPGKYAHLEAAHREDETAREIARPRPASILDQIGAPAPAPLPEAVRRLWPRPHPRRAAPRLPSLSLLISLAALLLALLIALILWRVS